MVPIYRCVVNLETKTVAISPINEFNAGIIKSINGMVYNRSLLNERTVPEINPAIEDIITIIMDSLKILE